MAKTSDTHRVHAAWQGYDLRALGFPLIFKKDFVYIHHLLGAHVPWHSCGGQRITRGVGSLLPTASQARKLGMVAGVFTC